MIARVSAGHLPAPQREREREDDARWHECVRASCPEGRRAEPLPPERRMGARRSGLGKTEAQHETSSNLGSVPKARSAVDGRTEGWGMRPPGPRERSRNIWEDNGVCRRLCSFFVLNCFGLKVKHKKRTKSFGCSGTRRQNNYARSHSCLRNDAAESSKKVSNRPITYDPATGVTLLLCRSKRD